MGLPGRPSKKVPQEGAPKASPRPSKALQGVQGSLKRRPQGLPGVVFFRYFSRFRPLRRKTADPHETLRLCSETSLGPPSDDPEFDRKSLREPPAKRSAKRTPEKVPPRPPKGVSGSNREPSGRSGSVSGGPGRAPKPLWTAPGSTPDRPWSPKGYPRAPQGRFLMIWGRFFYDFSENHSFP